MKLCKHCNTAKVEDDNVVGCTNCWEVQKRFADFIKSPSNRGWALEMLGGSLPNFDHLTDDPKELRRIGVKVEEYCRYKSYAMANRIKGIIPMAETHERVCESLYRELPEEIRW